MLLFNEAYYYNQSKRDIKDYVNYGEVTAVNRPKVDSQDNQNSSDEETKDITAIIFKRGNINSPIYNNGSEEYQNTSKHYNLYLLLKIIVLISNQFLSYNEGAQQFK